MLPGKSCRGRENKTTAARRAEVRGLGTKKKRATYLG
jgi:hypothetical protein